jgi:hypothetical protein
LSMCIKDITLVLIYHLARNASIYHFLVRNARNAHACTKFISANACKFLCITFRISKLSTKSDLSIDRRGFIIFSTSLLEMPPHQQTRPVRSAGFSWMRARFSLDVTGLCCNNWTVRVYVSLYSSSVVDLRYCDTSFYDLRILESLHHASESCFVLQDLGVPCQINWLHHWLHYLVYSLGQCIRHRFFDQIYLLKNTRLLSTFQREF